MKTKKPIPQDDHELATFSAAEAVDINPANIGSDFDAFLADEGLLEEVQAGSLKRVIAFQLAQTMKDKGLTKRDVARRMKTSRSQLDRILDPTIKTIQLDLIVRAAQCVGRKFSLTLA